MHLYDAYICVGTTIVYNSNPRLQQMDDLLATPDCTVDAFDYIPWQQVWMRGQMGSVGIENRSLIMMS